MKFFFLQVYDLRAKQPAHEIKGEGREVRLHNLQYRPKRKSVTQLRCVWQVSRETASINWHISKAKLASLKSWFNQWSTPRGIHHNSCSHGKILNLQKRNYLCHLLYDFLLFNDSNNLSVYNNRPKGADIILYVFQLFLLLTYLWKLYNK